MIAEIIINSNARALNRIFDYIIPQQLENEIRVGSRVSVPFGNGKKLDDGFVINLKENSEFANKEICKINIEQSLTEENVILAKLMARKYFCNISDCIKLMLPPGTGSKSEEDREKEKLGKFVYLKKNETEINELIENRKLKSEKQIRVAKFLTTNNGIYLADLEALADVSRSVLSTMEKNGIIKLIEEQLQRNPFASKKVKSDAPKKLTEEQKKCFDAISNDIELEQYSKSLIFGITGSGKTEIYLQLISKVLEKRKNCNCAGPRNFTYSSNGR